MIVSIAMKETTIPEVLKAWRKRRKLSQQTASIMLTVSISTLQKWEQGITEPSGIVQQFIRNKCK